MGFKACSMQYPKGADRRRSMAAVPAALEAREYNLSEPRSRLNLRVARLAEFLKNSNDFAWLGCQKLCPNGDKSS
jgi:hypothetical protein